jgi:hypothetical protein
MEAVLRAIFMHIDISKNEPFAGPGAPAPTRRLGQADHCPLLAPVEIFSQQPRGVFMICNA